MWQTLPNVANLAWQALLAALGNAAVHRLKHAKAKLTSKALSDLEGLSTLMAHASSYKNYRAQIASLRYAPPFIPYIGVHLSDLTFIGDGNKDVTVDGKINLAKRVQVVAILG